MTFIVSGCGGEVAAGNERTSLNLDRVVSNQFADLFYERLGIFAREQPDVDLRRR